MTTPKIVIDMGGDRLTIKAGGSLNIEAGAHVTVDTAQPVALTAQLTAITHTAPGTPDYAIQDLTNSSGFGFVTKDEGNSVLKVIANLQTRLAEVEDRLESLTFVAPN
jgi:hypothetical protein